MTAAESKPRQPPRFEHLIDRPAFLQPCRRCGAWVLAAITGGVPTRCDPGSLTAQAELIALLSGKQSYDVVTYGLPRRMFFQWRHATRITGERKYPVVATHKCNGTGNYLVTRTELAVPSPRHDDTDPPF
jgi:hypothetical protein